jgi:inosine-uridine nucleoside N-ribohydrolase
MPTPIIIDCDPGHDDAIAIMLALASPEVDLRAVTAVSGNAPLHHTVANAIRVLDHFGRADIPVAAGADRPLVQDPFAPGDVHGPTGLDGPDLPPPGREPSETHAIDLIAEHVLASPEPVVLVPTGPLTNVALFAARHPAAASRVDRVVLMGGATGFGNVTPNAEFNIWADPDAARRVFTSGFDVTMVGLDVTHLALLEPAHCDRLRGTGRAGRLTADLVEFYGRSHVGWAGSPIHDAVAVAHLIDPGMLTLTECHVDIDCTPECRGRTSCDLRGLGGLAPNARVATAIRPAFGDWICERLARLG